MDKLKEKILVVDDDSEVLDLIAHQTLQPAGYETRVANDINSALAEMKAFQPDLIIASLHLPGLNARDLLAALKSRDNLTPVIVTAERGQDQQVIQAFRLGATDTLRWPTYEPEVINVVERVLQQVREQKQRQIQIDELNQKNDALKGEVEELITVHRTGRKIAAVTDLPVLFTTIIQSATETCNADLGWLLIKDDKGERFILAAEINLPQSMAIHLNKPWHDGISTVAAETGRTFAAVKEALSGTMAGELGQSLMAAPILIGKQAVGLICIMRREATSFSQKDQVNLESLTDFSSIALVNAYRTHAAEDRARRLQRKADILDLSRGLQLFAIHAVTTGDLSSEKLQAELRTTITDIASLAPISKSIEQILVGLNTRIQAQFPGFDIITSIDPATSNLRISGYAGVLELVLVALIRYCKANSNPNTGLQLSVALSETNLIFSYLLTSFTKQTSELRSELFDPEKIQESGETDSTSYDINKRIILDCVGFLNGKMNIIKAEKGGLVIELLLPSEQRT